MRRTKWHRSSGPAGARASDDFLASDNQVVAVEFGAQSPRLRHSFESPVYSISYLSELEAVLVSYETGVARLTAAGGRKVWDATRKDVRGYSERWPDS